MKILPRPGETTTLQEGTMDPVILEYIKNQGSILPRPKHKQVSADKKEFKVNSKLAPDSGNKPLFPKLFAELAWEKGYSPNASLAGIGSGRVEKTKDSKTINVDAISGAAISSDKQEKPLGWFAQWVNKRAKSAINPEQGIPNEWDGIIQLLRNNKHQIKDSVSDAAWTKRLGLPYNEKFLPDNGDGSVRLPDGVASLINSDTTTAKAYIQSIDAAILENNIYLSKLSKTQNPEAILQYNLIKNHTDGLEKLKEQHNTTLNSLREISTTPDKKAVFNEYGITDPKSVTTRDTTDFAPYTLMNENPTPANALQNFTMWKDKNGITHYYDVYDFNDMEGIMTSTMRPPFKIQGTIKK